MKILSVVGARPQFVKLAPIAAAADAAGIHHIIVHTGQHYDVAMSDVFFDDLKIPSPSVNLGVGSGPHGRQTGAMLTGLERVLEDQRPDWVLAYGDTNSTVAAALAAIKLHVPLAHLEAGLRSFNRRMPEEHNRVLTDHASDLLLAPSQVALRNLAREGLADRTRHVGDVMVDVARLVADNLENGPGTLAPDGGPFILATIHRAENTDSPSRLQAIIDALATLHVRVVLAAHPRLVAKSREHGIDLARGAIRVIEPLPYRRMVGAIRAAAHVITDSGGVQKEAFILGTPCCTLRTETEWLETVELGWNVLVGNLNQLPELLQRPRPTETTEAPYGNGRAANAVLDALRSTPNPYT